jgi:hypothetical protein
MFAKKTISRWVSILFIGMLMLISFSSVYAESSSSVEQANAAEAQFLLNLTSSGHTLGLNTMDITLSPAGDGTTIRDIMLVIDTTSRMSYETSGNPDMADPGDDPAICNASHTCQPMEATKSAAIDYINLLSFPSDRVGIVAMTSQTPGGSRAPMVVLPLTSDKSTVQTALENLNRPLAKVICN